MHARVEAFLGATQSQLSRKWKAFQAADTASLGSADELKGPGTLAFRDMRGLCESFS